MRKNLVLCLVFLLCSATPLAAGPAKQNPESPVSQAEQALEQGSKGEQVARIQQLLADSGFYAGAIDGKFGPATRAAVEVFQKRYSLPVTGAVDRKMVDTMQRAKGAPDRYRRVINMEASAYTTQDPGNGSHTYRGHLLRKGLVAVDPSVIPLGTRLYIQGYGYAIADDIGSYIKGNRIDLAYESRAAALQFGRRTVPVYILD